ncbi:hypothetical protein DJ524_00160 [Sulfolobus sp. D5]|nr:hypothetical protein DJ524_00160 [Sulfolobus sp. D5]
MRIVIGSGLTGLLISERIKPDVILEEQPIIGGTHSFEDVFGVKIHLVPPLVDETISLNNFNLMFKEYDLDIYYRKYEHYKDKICEKCNELPHWIMMFEKTRKIYLIENLSEIFENISKKFKIIKEYPIRINNSKVITNKGNTLKYDILYNTTSLRRLLKALNHNITSLRFISALVILAVTPRKSSDSKWNIYLSGDYADSFSMIIKFNDIINNYDAYYIYSFFDENKIKQIDIERVLLDVKRRQIIHPNDIVIIRSKLISEAILLGEFPDNIENNIINCGRLGEWKNYSIIETIKRIQSC